MDMNEYAIAYGNISGDGSVHATDIYIVTAINGEHALEQFHKDHSMRCSENKVALSLTKL